MLSRARAALLLAAAAAADNTVCYTDCCDTSCIEINRKFNFPATTSADHGFKFTTSATISKDVTSATWNMTMAYMGTKINLSPSSGSVCDGEQTIKIEAGTLGSTTIDFSNGGTQSCPMKAGSVLGVRGSSQASSDPPMGKFLTTTRSFDQDGALISCQITQVGGCAPAPPPPAPGTQLYGCVQNVCTAAAAGVPLQTCQAVCHHPAPTTSAAAPPDPYDVGCASHTDCASCLATQVPGPVAIPGLKQNCGWCFRTNSCHDNQALVGQKCELKCSAKRLPVFDGPQCPYNTCTPKYYTCDKATGKCAQTDTGSIIEICDAECAFVPPPAAAQYQCAGGQCVQSPTGIDLDTCQALCNPPAPTP